jgi:mRNA interferase MazF
MKRGEIWWVTLDPGRVGQEIRKTRPAVIVNHELSGSYRLALVVPLIGWNAKHDTLPWMTPIEPNDVNKLTKKVSADSYQIMSISTDRLAQRIGYVSAEELVEIVAAVALVIGHEGAGEEDNDG